MMQVKVWDMQGHDCYYSMALYILLSLKASEPVEGSQEERASLAMCQQKSEIEYHSLPIC